MREFHIKMGFKGTIADIGLTKKDIPTLVEATLDCPDRKSVV